MRISTRSIPGWVDTHSATFEVAPDIHDDLGEGRQGIFILAHIARDQGIVAPAAGSIVPLRNQ